MAEPGLRRASGERVKSEGFREIQNVLSANRSGVLWYSRENAERRTAFSFKEVQPVGGTLAPSSIAAFDGLPSLRRSPMRQELLETLKRENNHLRKTITNTNMLAVLRRSAWQLLDLYRTEGVSGAPLLSPFKQVFHVLGLMVTERPRGEEELDRSSPLQVSQ